MVHPLSQAPQHFRWSSVVGLHVLSILILLFLLGAGYVPAAMAQAQKTGEPVRIRFSHVVAENTPKGQTALRFKALLEERTQGRMRVDIYPNAQLYSDRDEMEAMQLGAVEILAPSLSKFGRLGFPEFELFDLPFLFSTQADVRRITEGGLGQALLQRLQRQHMVGLGFLDNGFKHMSANRPLLEPADYLGLRMRVQSSRTIARQMRALGARPVDLPFSETRRALGTGVVDGTENPISNFWTQHMHEVQSDLTLTGHGFIGYAIVIHAPFWRNLSELQRQHMTSAMKEALAWGNSVAAGQNEQALHALRASGSTRIHELTPGQHLRLRTAVQPAWDDLARRIGQNWLDSVRQALNSP